MAVIVFLNDTIDHDNWGANACADALRAILQEQIPDVTFKSILSAWTTRRFRQQHPLLGGGIYWQRKRFVHRFSRPFYFLPAVADDFEAAADLWLRGQAGPFADRFLQAVQGADAVVFNAEGSTYRKNTSAVRCLFALWLAETKLNIPAYFLNGSVTLTPVDPYLPAMVHRTFRKLHGISVREPFSFRNVQTYAPDVPVEVVPDSVFHFAGKENMDVSANVGRILDKLDGKPYFCLSLSMLISMLPDYLKFGTQRTGLFHLIKELQKIVPQTVLLARDAMDQEIISALAEATGAYLFGPENGYMDLIGIYKNAAFNVSGRYHHLIMATIAGCPSIPLKTSSHKVDGLCELLDGKIGEAVDATWLIPQLDVLKLRADEYVHNRKGIAREFAEKVRVLCEKTRRLGEIVGKDLK